MNWNVLFGLFDKFNVPFAYRNFIFYYLINRSVVFVGLRETFAAHGCHLECASEGEPSGGTLQSRLRRSSECDSCGCSFVSPAALPAGTVASLPVAIGRRRHVRQRGLTGAKSPSTEGP
ncbi:hypothetical protein AVEN_226433-1 [Araneus ventricosus]|nr:hypothetical protein AVEN_226433-1 [Araneus ventricosus]